MSKTLSQFRTAFVGLIALLQVILLPATHVLHLGCQHSHGHGPTATATVSDAVESAWKRCSSAHCCHHCSKSAKTADHRSSNPAPAHPPHDEDSCPVCQAAFAARIATVATVALTTTEPVCGFVAENSQAVYQTPRYSVLSRGPPTAS